VSAFGWVLGAPKWLALALLAVGAFTAALSLAGDRQSLPHRYAALYVAYLERKLRTMFIMTSGRRIAAGQGIVAVLVVAAALISGEILLYATLPIVAAAPAAYIDQLKRQRIKAIESKLDSFIQSLANALKATPSLGNALAYTQPLLPAPLDDELGLALKEMRVGTTLDQALLNMSARIQSVELDATLAGLLIGRQVGGDLPVILETTAGTLREMTRLQGVVRSKTAEGKVQLLVVAVFPIFLLFGFDTLSPGYFDPLTSSPLGWVVITVSVVLWLVALIVARRVLAVDL